MLIMDAVLETCDATDFALWPIADPPPNHFLPLSGELSAREIGTAMAVLTSYNKTDHERQTLEPEDSMEQVSHLLTTDCVIAPGGLQIRNTATGVTASPGCCFGLENWRDWLDLMNGEELWLGHDPTPRVEYVGAIARLWPDGNHQEELPIDLPLAQLPELLSSVQDQLVGFLASVEEWTICHAPPLAAAVVAKLNEDLVIGAPLREGQGRDAHSQEPSCG
ncbi:hypothetical protein ACF08M_15770 [Streptomyces sp. NPDC015032]|uniref:hypothetical protein n=1 Tax=Streptomyces sp. NPDC015032 TaxID=3364937 RepID=UPI0036FADCCC